MGPAGLRNTTCGERAFTLIELLVVILILGILLAIAAPSFLGQQTKAQDSAAEQALTVGYKEAKAYWTNNQAFSTSAALVSALQSGEPQNTWTAGNTCPQMPQIGVNVLSSGQANLCTQSASGNNVGLVITPGQTVERFGTVGSATTYTNLVSNPSFETNTTGWAVGNGPNASPIGGATFTRTTSWAYTGSASAHSTATVTGNDASDYSPAFPASPGDTVAATAVLNIIQAASGGGPVIQVEWDNGSNTWSLGAYTPSATAWRTGIVPLSVVTTAAPAGTTQARLRVAGSTSGTQTIDWYLDSVVAVKNTTSAPGYFDGNFPGGGWTGTANNSTSTGWSGTSW